jgi:hypothetical protein
VREVAVRRFEMLGDALFAVSLLTAIGLAVCWATGLRLVDPSDRLFAMLSLIAASIYLAGSSLIAGAIFGSCRSPLANRFYVLAALSGAFGFVMPVIVEVSR